MTKKKNTVRRNDVIPSMPNMKVGPPQRRTRGSNELPATTATRASRPRARSVVKSKAVVDDVDDASPSKPSAALFSTAIKTTREADESGSEYTEESLATLSAKKLAPATSKDIPPHKKKAAKHPTLPPPPTAIIEDAPVVTRLRQHPPAPPTKGKKRAWEPSPTKSGSEDEEFAEEEDGEDEIPSPPAKSNKRRRRAPSPPPLVPPQPRLFAAGVSVPPLPPPVATEVFLPPPPRKPIEPVTGFRRTKNKGKKAVNRPRSQAELRHNMGTVGPLLIRDELRPLFTLPATHFLHEDIRCTNCIIHAAPVCGPPTDFIGACDTCRKSKLSQCSFIVDSQAELTMLGQLHSSTTTSTYHLARATQGLLADQSAIHLTVALLQTQITRAALNIEAYAHEWQRSVMVHGEQRLRDYGLARNVEEIHDFIEFLKDHDLGTTDFSLSARMADQQRVISRILEMMEPRAGDPILQVNGEKETPETGEALVLQPIRSRPASPVVSFANPPSQPGPLRWQHVRHASRQSNRSTGRDSAVGSFAPPRSPKGGLPDFAEGSSKGV